MRRVTTAECCYWRQLLGPPTTPVTSPAIPDVFALVAGLPCGQSSSIQITRILFSEAYVGILAYSVLAYVAYVAGL